MSAKTTPKSDRQKGKKSYLSGALQQGVEGTSPFLWGAATAAHQVEGNNTKSDWWAWEQAGGGAEPSGIACDHYHLFEKDFQLAKKMDHNAHRLSIEWARLEPKPGRWDEDEVAHYREVLRCLKKMGMKTMVTLHHFTNPKWLADRGGWLDPDTPKRFERYATFAAEKFSGLVDYWLTINEPGVYVIHGYVNVLRPPQEKSLIKGLRAYLNMARAHNLAYQAIHRRLPQAQVGMAKSMAAWHGGKPRLVLGPLSRLLGWVANQSFYWFTRGHHDFLGVNYYLLRIFRFGLPKFKVSSAESGEIIANRGPHLGWAIYPMGIYEVLTSLRKYRLPIYITENGTAEEGDRRRSDFIINHLEWVKRAVKEGVDVRGYFYWTLMDNYEWHLGRSCRFGLCETDYQTLERRPRKLAKTYMKIIKGRSFS